MSIGHHMPDVLARTMVTDHCWLWLGSRSTKGYGQIERNRKHLQVHRIAFESEYGDIPAGLVVDHTCHDPAVCVGGTCVHRLCVNPAHLSAVTNEENLARQVSTAKTHCDWGHELQGANLGLTRQGHRYCVSCSRRRAKAWRLKRFTVEPSAVRAWCLEQGLEVGVRGRVPSWAIDAWNEAHPELLFREIATPAVLRDTA